MGRKYTLEDVGTSRAQAKQPPGATRSHQELKEAREGSPLKFWGEPWPC